MTTPEVATSEILVCDYDTARPAPDSIKAAGYIAVIRYLDDNLVPGKSLEPAERDALLAAGLGIGLIWETTANRALSGAVAGAQDGATAVKQAKSLGMPAGAPLYANLGDFVATGAQIPTVHAYYYAFRRVAGWDFSSGGYGTAFIINSLVDAGAVGEWWQNGMNDAGIPGDIVSPHATLYQRTVPTHVIAGSTPADYDEDVALLPVPWWRASATPPPPPVVPNWLLTARQQAGALAALLNANE